MFDDPLNPDISLPLPGAGALLEDEYLPLFRRPSRSVTRPIFIVGCPRSGTTLVGACLSRHRQIAGADESLFLLDLSRIIRDLHGGHNHRAWAPLAEYLSQGELLSSMGEFADSIIGSLVRRCGKVRFVDHTPWYVACMPLINCLYGDSAFIHLLRDGRDVVRSLQESFHRGFRWAGDSISASAALWNTLTRKGVAFGRSLPCDRYLEVRYENLCADPATELQQICDFIRVPWEEDILIPLATPHASPSTEHSALAHMYPDGRLQLTPRFRGEDWPSHWTEEEKSQFSNEASSMMHFLGYW